MVANGGSTYKKFGCELRALGVEAKLEVETDDAGLRDGETNEAALIIER